MNHTSTLLFLAMALSIGGQEARGDSFLTRDDMPNAVNYLPVYPYTDDTRYLDDWVQYSWGKTVRNTTRGQQAVADAIYSVSSISKGFNAAFGMTISSSNTPELYKLLTKALGDCSNGTYVAKNYYMRKRPFDYYGESSATPNDEASLRKNGSYPSGHTTAGWTFALLLAEINPARQDTILSRGYQYGQSRVIVGVHYQSDVTAGRLVASAVVARLHADADFMEQLKKAKAEFAAKSGM